MSAPTLPAAEAEQTVAVVPGEVIAAVYGDPSTDLLRLAALVSVDEPIGAEALRAHAARQEEVTR